ncbi:hypothetical protein ACFFQW_17985 [Umezawaea endophytica]|uniref:Uncharacterized protein n=1 Tax=Umezawaea endophytica TaxID=1654476 RepID=A0A9X3A234_9PSEU|nr:hypothetical protein [Umezawaea endophytica]MCS7478573.1 hypothetical protein [Umezawaea endophytica]
MISADGELPGVANQLDGVVHGHVVQAGSIQHANLGVHVGDVNLFTGVPVTTRYHKQVLRIAPKELVGRETELAELAAFCTSPTGGYAWWRASAWSGKTALMSWFVLHPPPGVRLVSFFITARLSGQSTRTAFIDNVMGQLLDLTSQQQPAFLTDANREAHLLGLFDDAAAACADRGEHLVLLVDGLDEDRGVHTGFDAYSIAALLPEEMRVVVAGRPDPELPADVPEHHPLRNPAIIRPLGPSPRAQVIRVEAERELRALLKGDPVGVDLLGLVASAGGGLTAADLAVLTATSEWAVKDLLGTVAGRSFARRRTSAQAADIYLLGHEELQAIAVAALGLSKLEHYRARLHAWADGYREQGWPVSTPDYLLRGYFAVLVETDDVPRMVACATDPARQDRVLAQSGGDASSLDEIAAAQSTSTDLVASTRLAVHRDYLGHRNARIPRDLPAAWLAAGHADRATATARSIVDPVGRAETLVSMAAQSTDHPGSIDAQAEAQAVIASITDVHARSKLLAALAVVVAEQGDLDHAELLFGLAPTVPEREAVATLLSLARGAMRLGDQRWGRLLTTASRAVKSPYDPHLGRRRMTSVIRTAAELGDLDRVVSLVAGRSRAEALPFLTVAAVQRGDYDHAEVLVRAVADPADRADLLMGMAKTGSGPVDRWISDVRETAHEIGDPGHRARILFTVATAVHDEAAFAAGKALADASTDEWLRRLTLETATAMGNFTFAAELIKSVRNHYAAAVQYTALAAAVAKAGEADHAAELLFCAEIRARLVTGIPFTAAETLTEVARAVAEFGDVENATRIAQEVGYDSGVPELLVMSARATIRAGDSARAATILADAERLVRNDTGRTWHATTVKTLADSLASAANLDDAVALVSASGADWRSRRWTGLVTSIAQKFATAGGTHLADEARFRTLNGAGALAVSASAVYEIGYNGLALRLLDQAERIAASLQDQHQLVALTLIRDTAVDVGDRRRATAVWARRNELAHSPYRRSPMPVLPLRRPRNEILVTAAVLPGPVDEVLRSEAWHLAVPAVLKADPAAIDVVIAELSIAARVSPVRSP